MHETYYEKQSTIFKNYQLLYTDTDSLVLKITDSNIYKIMQGNEDMFEISEYPKEHVLYIEKNKKSFRKVLR